MEDDPQTKVEEAPKNNSQPNASIIAIPLAKVTGLVPIVTFAGAFLLYVFGFIIWNAYLSKFGLSASNLNTFDYFSAALSFLVYCCAVGAPFWLLSHQLLISKDREFSSASWGYLGDWRFIFLWWWIISRLPAYYFPAPFVVYTHFEIIGSVLVVHLLSILYRCRKHPQTNALNVLKNASAFKIYLIIQALIDFASVPSVSVLFILLLCGLYILIAGIYGYTSRNGPFFQIRFESTGSKLLFCILVPITLLGTAISYGQLQFEGIVRLVGGGQPENAIIYFNSGVHLPRISGKEIKAEEPCAVRVLVENNSAYYVLVGIEKKETEDTWVIEKKNVTLVSMKWTPKVGQRGTDLLNKKGTVTHVQETTSA